MAKFSAKKLVTHSRRFFSEILKYSDIPGKTIIITCENQELCELVSNELVKRLEIKSDKNHMIKPTKSGYEYFKTLLNKHDADNWQNLMKLGYDIPEEILAADEMTLDQKLDEVWPDFNAHSFVRQNIRQHDFTLDVICNRINRNHLLNIVFDRPPLANRNASNLIIAMMRERNLTEPTNLPTFWLICDMSEDKKRDSKLHIDIAKIIGKDAIVNIPFVTPTASEIEDALISEKLPNPAENALSIKLELDQNSDHQEILSLTHAKKLFQNHFDRLEWVSEPFTQKEDQSTSFQRCFRLSEFEELQEKILNDHDKIDQLSPSHQYIMFEIHKSTVIPTSKLYLESDTIDFYQKTKSNFLKTSILTMLFAQHRDFQYNELVKNLEQSPKGSWLPLTVADVFLRYYFTTDKDDFINTAVEIIHPYYKKNKVPYDFRYLTFLIVANYAEFRKTGNIRFPKAQEEARQFLIDGYATEFEGTDEHGIYYLNLFIIAVCYLYPESDIHNIHLRLDEKLILLAGKHLALKNTAIAYLNKGYAYGNDLKLNLAIEEIQLGETIANTLEHDRAYGIALWYDTEVKSHGCKIPWSRQGIIESFVFGGMDKFDPQSISSLHKFLIIMYYIEEKYDQARLVYTKLKSFLEQRGMFLDSTIFMPIIFDEIFDEKTTFYKKIFTAEDKKSLKKWRKTKKIGITAKKIENLIRTDGTSRYLKQLIILKYLYKKHSDLFFHEDLKVLRSNSFVEIFFQKWSGYEFRSKLIQGIETKFYYETKIPTSSLNKSLNIIISSCSKVNNYSDLQLTIGVAFAILTGNSIVEFQIIKNNGQIMNSVFQNQRDMIHFTIETKPSANSQKVKYNDENITGNWFLSQDEDSIIVYQFDTHLRLQFRCDKEKKSEIAKRIQHVASESVLFETLDQVFDHLNTREAVQTIEREKNLEILNKTEKAKEFAKLAHRATTQVKERNQQISQIMTHINQGIFTIDKKLQIGEQFSPFLCQILESEHLARASIKDVLLRPSLLLEDQKKAIEEILRSSIDSNSLTFEANQSSLPHELELNFKSGRKTVEIDWLPLGSSDMVSSIMITIRDVTELRQLSAQTTKIKEKTMIIENMINLDAINLGQFMTNVNIFAEELSKGILLSQARDDLKRKIHTIKGLSRVFGFAFLANQLHILEDHTRKEGTIDLKVEIGHTLASIRNHQEIYHQLFENQVKSTEGLKNDIMKVLNGYRSSESYDNHKTSVTQIFNHLGIFRSIESVLKPLFDDTRVQSEQLNLPIPEFLVEGPEVQVNSDLQDTIVNVFTHLLSNSVAHGFSQMSQSKPMVFIRALVTDSNCLQMSYCDNGVGLNLNKITEKAIKLGIINNDQSLSTLEKAELIFSHGFSSASKVDHLSGRGVGLDAVRSELESSGHTITLKLLERIGNEIYRFEFQITMRQGMELVAS